MFFTRYAKYNKVEAFLYILFFMNIIRIIFIKNKKKIIKDKLLLKLIFFIIVIFIINILYQNNFIF